jgi:putative ABC transport system permease protein
VPLAQHELTSATLHLRAAPGQGETLRRRLPAELLGLRLGLASVRVRSLEEWVGSVLAVPRALVAALGWLGVLGLFLAAVGLYGVTAYIAGRRARECALRQVLGASRLSILRLLVGGAMGTVLAGLGAGVGLSLVVGWLLKDAFLGASFDPLALVAAPVALAATALLAVTLPVVQAGAREPMNLLREE